MKESKFSRNVAKSRAAEKATTTKAAAKSAQKSPAKKSAPKKVTEAIPRNVHAKRYQLEGFTGEGGKKVGGGKYYTVKEVERAKAALRKRGAQKFVQNNLTARGTLADCPHC